MTYTSDAFRCTYDSHPNLNNTVCCTEPKLYAIKAYSGWRVRFPGILGSVRKEWATNLTPIQIGWHANRPGAGVLNGSLMVIIQAMTNYRHLCNVRNGIKPSHAQILGHNWTTTFIFLCVGYLEIFYILWTVCIKTKFLKCDNDVHSVPLSTISSVDQSPH
jgi:hypothetical protein